MDLKGIYTADANRYGEAEALYPCRQPGAKNARSTAVSLL